RPEQHLSAAGEGVSTTTKQKAQAISSRNATFSAQTTQPFEKYLDFLRPTGEIPAISGGLSDHGPGTFAPGPTFHRFTPETIHIVE
ncbi:hypothetical protein, partial [Sagittula salina]